MHLGNMFFQKNVICIVSASFLNLIPQCIPSQKMRQKQILTKICDPMKRYPVEITGNSEKLSKSVVLTICYACMKNLSKSRIGLMNKYINPSDTIIQCSINISFFQYL